MDWWFWVVVGLAGYSLIAVIHWGLIVEVLRGSDENSYHRWYYPYRLPWWVGLRWPYYWGLAIYCMIEWPVSLLGEKLRYSRVAYRLGDWWYRVRRKQSDEEFLDEELG